MFNRHDILTTKTELTTSDCLTVLKVAKDDFLAVIGKVYPDESTLETSEILLVLYYLEALIVLKHLQRVGVTKMMTVSIYYLLHLLTFSFFNRLLNKAIYFMNR